MPYSIVLSNNLTQINIADQTLDTTSTSLTLVGKNYGGYGQYVATDLVHLAENFASLTAPANPLIGQLWFSTSTKLLNVCTNNNPVTWVPQTTGVSQVIGLSGSIALSQLTAPGLLAPQFSPVFAGVPTTTVPTGTVTNQIATVGYVQSQVATVVGGVSSISTSTGTLLTGAITFSQLSSGGLAPLNSPAFTGIPTVPQPSVGNNSQQIATTAFVYSQVAALTAGVSSVANLSGTVTLAQLITAGLAPIASPNFSGTPTINGTATGNQIATNTTVTTAVTNLLAANSTWTGVQTFVATSVFQTGLTVTGADAHGAQVRITDGSSGNGAILLNNNTGFFLLQTANNDVYGNFNALRPFFFNYSTGQVTIDATGAGTFFGGATAAVQIYANNDIISSGGRVHAKYGATGATDATIATILADFPWVNATQLISGATNYFGHQTLPTGLIIQWTEALLPNQLTSPVYFPEAFPNVCFLVVGSSGSGIATSSNVIGVGCQPNGVGSFSVTVASSVPGSTGCYFIALGY